MVGIEKVKREIECGKLPNGSGVVLGPSQNALILCRCRWIIIFDYAQCGKTYKIFAIRQIGDILASIKTYCSNITVETGSNRP